MRHEQILRLAEKASRVRGPGRFAVPTVGHVAVQGESDEEGSKFKTIARKLLNKSVASAKLKRDNDGLGYRAYLRAVIAGQPTQHLINKSGEIGKGAKKARQALIDARGEMKESTMDLLEGMRTGTEREFSAVRNYPHAQVKYMHAGKGGKVQDISVTYKGKEIGHMTRIGNRVSNVMVDPDFLSSKAKNESRLNEIAAKDGKVPVKIWLQLLSGALTSYDRKASRRERSPNIHRLALLLDAAADVEKAMKPHMDKDDPATLDKLVNEMKKAFIFERGKFSISDLNRLVKKIEEYKRTGKQPKYEADEQSSLTDTLVEALEEAASTEFECQECGRRFKKKLTSRTVEVKCPKCGGYDTLPTEYFGATRGKGSKVRSQNESLEEANKIGLVVKLKLSTKAGGALYKAGIEQILDHYDAHGEAEQLDEYHYRVTPKTSAVIQKLKGDDRWTVINPKKGDKFYSEAKEPAKSGDELDMVTKAPLKYLDRPGVKKTLKRAMNKRARQSGKKDVQQQMGEAKTRIARWESRSKKHWVDLYKDKLGYTYRSPTSGGNLGSLPSDEAAVQEIEKKIKMGLFQPDAAKTPMKRTEAVSEGVPEKHQLKIAKDTLKMKDSMVGVMGGMTKDQARAFLRSQGWSDARIKKLEGGANEGEEPVMEPGFVKTPEDEKKWDRAKEIARKQNPDDLYALANHIYHNMKGESSVNEMSDKALHKRIAALSNEIQRKKAAGEDWSKEKSELLDLRKQLQQNESSWQESFRMIIGEAADPPVIRDLRKIVKTKSAGKAGGQKVDMYTASAILSVYDKLKPGNQASMAKMPVLRMADVAFKLIKKFGG